MIIKTIKCDVCGIQKKETNHWLHVRYDIREKHETLTVSVDDVGMQMDICGDECAHKIMSQWLTNLKEQRDKNQKLREKHSADMKLCASTADWYCAE